MITHFVANSEKCRKYSFLGGSAQIIPILHRGGYRNSLKYYMGGGVFLIFYNITIGEGGVSRDPKIVLRNIWTASEITHLNSLTVLKKTFGLRAILDN